MRKTNLLHFFAIACLLGIGCEHASTGSVKDAQQNSESTPAANSDERFEDAKLRLNENQIEEGVAKLREYLSQPNATRIEEATQLLKEAEIASSDEDTVKALMALSDEEFESVRTTGKLTDGAVADPILATLREKTILRNLDSAVTSRRVAKEELERVRDAERIAQIERKRKAEEIRRESELRAPLEVLLGGTVNGNDAVFCRQPMKFEEKTKPKKTSEFDEVPNWDSAYRLSNIRLADGVLMDVSIENTGGLTKQTAWAWRISAVDPSKGEPSGTCSLDFSIDGRIVKYSFDPVVKLKLIVHAYNFPTESRSERVRGGPLQPVFKEIVDAKKVRYQLTIGSKKVEADLPAEVQDGLKKLLGAAAYEDRQSQLNRMLHGR